MHNECNSLKTLYCKSTTPPGIYFDDFKNLSAIYVPAASLELYKTKWVRWADIIYPEE